MNIEERLERLEDAVRALAIVSVEANRMPDPFGRAPMAHDARRTLIQYLSERDE